MTIEEKAREEYPYITPSDGYEDHDYNEAAKDGFIDGAKWMLDKACEYIKTQYPVHYQEWAELADEYVEQFKKAMEE